MSLGQREKEKKKITAVVIERKANEPHSCWDTYIAPTRLNINEANYLNINNNKHNYTI